MPEINWNSDHKSIHLRKSHQVMMENDVPGAEVQVLCWFPIASFVFFGVYPNKSSVQSSARTGAKRKTYANVQISR